MNTRLHLTKNTDNNLIILSDDSHLDWADDYLSTGETTILANGIKNEIKDFVFPRPENFVFVHIAKSADTNAIAKENARLAGADVLDQIEHYKLASVTVRNFSQENRTYQFVEGMVLGNYQFLKYFSDKEKKKNKLEEIHIHHESLGAKAFEDLQAVTEATCKARTLVNEPLSYLTAPQLSEEIKEAGEKYGFSVKVLEKAEIEQMGMGGLLSVNLGSFTPPTFNIMEWMPENAKNENPVVLVGKGVVYDTGGVSLKPTKNSMDFMKCDMGGAATVVGLMIAVAKANLPIKVVGLIGATDNRPGKDAYVPGDVVKTYSGKTVEVLNTDAEGRMTMADSLHYAKQYNPELVMDFATLTGAAAYSIGPEGICYMGNADSKVKHRLEECGYAVHERLVEFPMWKEYGDTIKSDVADIKNLGGSYAGMITAGKFLEHFTDYPWLHFDIAGPAYLHAKKGYLTKEGTGVGVRLVFEYLKNY